MSTASDEVTITLPRSAFRDVLALSDELTDRMHALLERNTDGSLSPVERTELETLVRMAQFGEVLAMALHGRHRPRASRRSRGTCA